MSDKKDDGGPAFPVIHEVPPQPGQEKAISVNSGITMRDYFAAKAVQSLMSHEIYRTENDETFAQAHARQAYEYADAMLAARKV